MIFLNRISFLNILAMVVFVKLLGMNPAYSQVERFVPRTVTATNNRTLDTETYSSETIRDYTYGDDRALPSDLEESIPDVSPAGKCDYSSIPDMHPEKVQSWLKQNEGSDIGDVLCCMDPNLQRTLQITHSSISAQAGIRLLFGNFENYGMMFSVSAEEKGADQVDAIEYAVNSERSDQIDMFDLLASSDTGGEHLKLTKNPDSCVGCHGDTNGQYGPYGARLIVDDAPWSRQNGVTNCPHADEYSKKMLDRARGVIGQKDRFRCLNKDIINNTITKIENANDINTQDMRRIAREIVASENYESFKYVIFGLAFGCFHSSIKDKHIDSWIPPLASSQMNISSHLRSDVFDKDIDEIVDLVRVEREADMARRTVRDKEIQYPTDGSKPASLDQDQLKYCKSNKKSEEEVDRRIMRKMKSRSLADEYIKDEILNEGNYELGLFRFIFESRGIPTRNWNTANDRESTKLNINSLAYELKKYDPEIARELGEAPSMKNPFYCKKLRVKSMVKLNTSRFPGRSRTTPSTTDQQSN